MTIQKTHVAALALAGALTVTAATQSFADNRWGYAAGGFAAGAVVGAAAANANAGYYGPGYVDRSYGYAYAPTAGYYGPTYSYSYGPNYDPENARDPDPRIGGSFRMNSSGDD